jgi:hypothetical protein
MERGKQMTASGLVHLSIGNDESALAESTGLTGKRSASKDARSVWKGGKTARSYLSLPYRPSNFFRSTRLLLQGLTLEKRDLYFGVSDTAVGVARGQDIVPSTSLVVVVYGEVEGIAVFWPQ